MISYAYSISFLWQIPMDWMTSKDGISARGGVCWFMCAGGGDPSFSRRQTFST
jgi:hypothetical protein